MANCGCEGWGILQQISNMHPTPSVSQGLCYTNRKNGGLARALSLWVKRGGWPW